MKRIVEPDNRSELYADTLEEKQTILRDADGNNSRERSEAQ